MTKLLGSLMLALALTLALTTGAAWADAQNGQLHVTKDCRKNTGTPG
jgi:hypothetical protein